MLIPIQSQLPELVEAVQEQSGPAVTLTLPDPAPGPKVLLVGEIEKEQVIVTKKPDDQSETTEVSRAHLALAFTV